MSETLTSLCRDLRDHMDLWTRRHGLACVWNDDLNRYIRGLGCERVKWILVGDNPGESESLDGRYFSCFGQTGAVARNIFRDHCRNVENYCAEVMTLNKTPVFTKKTEQLRSYLDQELFLETQRHMANVVFSAHKIVESTDPQEHVRVWIIGHDWDIFRAFFTRLRELYSAETQLANRVYISGHFSHSQFQQEVGAKWEDSGLVTSLKSLKYWKRLRDWNGVEANPWVDPADDVKKKR